MDSDLIRRANEVIDAAIIRTPGCQWTEQERLIRDLASALGETEAGYRASVERRRIMTAQLEEATKTIVELRREVASLSQEDRRWRLWAESVEVGAIENEIEDLEYTLNLVRERAAAQAKTLEQYKVIRRMIDAIE